MSRLQEHEYEFCIALHAKLKEQVKGKVFTTVENDTLKVEIHMGRTDFDMSFENFSDKVSFGLATDDVVKAVTNTYKKFLMNNLDRLYFK